MNWIDGHSWIKVYPPQEFNFDECLLFLGRSDQEILHQIKGGCLYKLIRINGEFILFKIDYIHDFMNVEFLNVIPSEGAREKVAEYIWEWFELDVNLERFYEWADDDPILAEITQKYYGLRMIGIHDLFEALVWAILGQQINLTFAYTLKKRFVEQFGESQAVDGVRYWLFPACKDIASLDVEDLRKLQITGRKAEYIIGIARAMNTGELNKESLLEQDVQQVRKALLQYKGIGAWTADYVMMKCLHFTTSFPIADVGLHNALKVLLGYDRKPTLKEMEQFSVKWEGWQGYAAFYLWRSLYDEHIQTIVPITNRRN
ncbi:DNA-3-methyladenine glycosylase 2 family protein [Bacillus haikouensis]|jgi:DNA-3-methyladenine glycosylase II|uniref:DNA-3-methyladenine glycosylase family protein n=1 Tax=Bacillus haikouensis TaxID=1510468 RepID=UPI0015522753|nr:DNA-3-methyladenine glycosylase [Bacillus haikouensis]NQD68260.1 DNA-3-methyladenine glycosylase 2 family protein [Bacillus haikouensis]